MVWETCVIDNDYEIETEYPHQIRRKSTHQIVEERSNADGYLCVILNDYLKYKHRVIAYQFIPNDDPDKKTQVTHYDQNKSNNRIENLRWVSPKEIIRNNKNKGSMNGIKYEFVDSIPNDCIVVDTYSKWSFEDLYFYDDVFYFYNGIKFKKCLILKDKSGSRSIHAIADNGENVRIYYSKFKREYGLI